MNNVKVFVMMAGLTALFGWVGALWAGRSGMIVALVLAGVVNFIMYWTSSSMVLRMYGAQVVSPSEAPELYEMVDRLRQRAGLPMPTVAIAPHQQPNAFATGRNPEHAVVCVTRGILELVPPQELEGVIAHELAHVKNHDMLLQTFAATLAGAISNLANFALFFGRSDRDDRGGSPIVSLLMVLVAPVAAMLIQFAISRQREFKADAGGAEISGRPLDLAHALAKLDAYSRRIPMNVSPAVAPLAQVNPLSANRGVFLKWFSTHPPIQERIARLEAMAGRETEPPPSAVGF